jgi:hypothetical protein
VSLEPALVVSPQRELVGATRPGDMAPARSAAILNNRPLIVCLVFCVGPIGLLCLWLSPRFSLSSKVLTTAGYFAVTLLIPLAIAYYYLDVSLQPLLRALEHVPR